ncbi:DUF5979 domain-containing protein [Demequina sp.]|uniref:DUF5979 domain-containing protein n=1 Tax=Demequina sp. TaxID=2050685 RepID=UPI003A88C6DA
MAWVASAAIAVTTVGLVATSASADPGPAGLSITKSVSQTSIAPGDTFTYTIQVSCVYTTAAEVGGCVNALVSDTLPPQFSLNGPPEVVSAGNTTVVTGEEGGGLAEILFNTPFSEGEGGSGMVGGTTATITIPVIADNLTYEDDGDIIRNTATFDADNPDTESDSDGAIVRPDVPLVIDSDVSKSFTPAMDIAEAGTATTIDIAAQNTSEAGLDEWTITEPVDPTASPNPFDYLAFEDLTIGDFPANADQVQIDVYGPSGWVSGTASGTPTLPGSVAPEDIRGIRITFSTSGDELILPGESVDISIDTVQRELGELASNLTVDNTVGSTVERDGETDDSSGDASYVIEANIPEVTADKDFDPDSVLHGDTADATLTGTVAGDLPVGELSIVEPALTGAGPNAPGFDDSMSFEGFAEPAVWPDGAESGTITYYCVGGGTESFPLVDGEPTPLPSEACEVARFRMDFEGLMDPGASAEVKVTVGTDPDDEARLTELNNEFTTVGTTPGGASDSDSDDDTLYVYGERLDALAGKTIVPSTILGQDGEWVVVELDGGIAGLPDSPGDTTPPYSSAGANDIVIQDPVDPADDEFWDAFNPDRITNVVVPDGATLTIEYYDSASGSWEVLEADIGPGTYSLDLTTLGDPTPDEIGGLRFHFHSDEGFPPGTNLQPNFVMNFDGASGVELPIVIDNCAGTDATNTTGADPSTSAPACDDVNVLDPDEPGTGGVGDLVDKNWRGGDPPEVFARSGDRATADIFWSTGGYSNADSVTITDMDPPDPVDQSVYDAFNLVRIEAITPDTDPYIAYDAVDAVLLWDGDSWEEASDSPCGPLDGAVTADCTGQLPQIDLTAAEQESTTAVQIVFVESPDRATSTDVEAPPVGSGVARSIGNERPISLVFEVRDGKRSDPSAPVTGHDIYNDGEYGADAAADEGLVWNQVSAEADYTDRDAITDTASDPILIIDDTLIPDVEKSWTDNEVGIPPVGTDPDLYPHAPVTLEATNASLNAAVDELELYDGPSPTPVGGYEMFDVFDFEGFTTLEMPAGATGVEITMFDADGGELATASDTTTALGWTPDAAFLPDVAAFEIVWTGRIEPGASATVEFQTQLRTTVRGTDTAIDDTFAGESILNTALAAVDDAGRDLGDDPENPLDPPTDLDTATADLEPFDIGLRVQKEFGPLSGDLSDSYTQVEPDNSEFLMVLESQPSEGARPVEVVVTDFDESFWNVYEFVRIDDSFALETPVDQIQMRVRTDATFTGEPGGDLTVTGGTYEIGPVGSTPELPAGVTPADVQGVEFIMNREGGLQWEGPIHPVQQIPIVIKRRAEMLSGGAPPTDIDLADNLPSPGETEAGHTWNTVEGEITSFLDAEGGDPLVEEAVPDDAEVIYEHSYTAVEVDKGPEGTVSPGAVIPYTLTFTNTGDTPIFNPVFTDTLPADGEGSLLLIDPSAAETGESPYSFALTGTDPDPSVGTPLPEDPAGVTIAESLDADPPTIEFSFPDGYVLGVGQSYTITIDMVTRTALEADTIIPNTATVVGDRPFDSCNGELSDPAVAECSDSTEVTLAAGGAISAVKRVKADDPSLGTTSAVEGADCVADEDGFYGAPCIPISAPGTTETWRLVLTNTGNVDLTTLTVIDRLPDVGDKTVLEQFDRDSEWHPELLDPTFDVQDPLLGALTVYGTTDAEPCDDDIRLGLFDCPASAWTPIEDFDGDYSEVTGIKYVFDFRDLFPLKPGDTVTIDIKTRTPVVSETAGADTITWNTVAAGAQTEDGDRILPTEGNKVGVALATGPLAVLKEIDGLAQDFAPSPLTVELVCTVDVDGEAVEAYRETLELVPGEQVTIEDLPYGAECALEEGDNGQTSVDSESAVVGREDDPLAVATLTNIYDEASLLVSKTVIGSEDGGTADPEDAGPFLVFVACEFLGETVVGDGYDPGQAMFALLRHGEEFQITGLPAGAECTITELIVAGAVDSTTIDWATAIDSGIVTGTTVTVVVTPDDPQGAPAPEGTTNTADIVNAFDLGSFALDKIIDGSAADEVTGPFEFHVLCVLPRPLPLADIVTFEDDVVLGGDNPLSTVVSGVPLGSTCTITETDDLDADGWAISVDGTPVEPVALDEDGNPFVEITIDDALAVTDVEVTDIFEQRVPVSITKEIDEDVANQDGEAPGVGPFTVALACVYGEGTAYEQVVYADGYDADSPMEAILEAGQTVVFDGLIAGSECTVTETEAAGADDTTIVIHTADGDVSVPGDEATFTVPPLDEGEVAADIEVINDWDVGSLTLGKIVDGAAAADVTGPFTVHVLCTFDDPASGETIPTWDGDVILGGDEPWEVTIDGIIVGSECTITETDDLDADGWTIEVDGAAVDPLTLDDEGNPYVEVPVSEAGTTVEVSFTNIVEQRVPVAITKVIDEDVVNQDGEAPELGPFTVTLACVYGEGTAYEQIVYADGYDADNPMEAVIEAGEEVVFDGLLSNSVCTVTETDAAGADDTTIVIHTADGDTTVPGDEATFTVPGAEDGALAAEIEIINDWEVGAVTLAKELTGDGAEELGTGPFALHMQCVLPGPTVAQSAVVWDGDVILGGDQPWEQTIDGIPTGSICTVTETDMGDADYVEFTPGTPGLPLSVVTIGAEGDDPVTVTAANHFEQLASLAVTKTVGDEIADAEGNVPDLGPFAVRVQCVYGEGTVHEQVVYADGYGRLRPMLALLDDGETAVFTGLPATSECTVTELANGGATSTEVIVTTADGGPTSTDGSVGTVVLTPDADGETTSFAQVHNVFAPGALEITKRIDGADAPADAGPFTFTVECTLERPGRAAVSTWSGEVVLGGSQPLTATIDGIVAGSECVVTETVTGGADRTTLTPAGASATEAVVTIAAGATVTVTAVNVWDDDLPMTGFDSWWIVIAAGVLLIGGVVLLIVRRKD